MKYGRRPLTYRRYPGANKEKAASNASALDAQTELDTIPLPNEPFENETVSDSNKRFKVHKKHKPSIFDTFKDHLGMEEVILLGVIFLLLQEGEMDDILLIILAYILLTGKE